MRPKLSIVMPAYNHQQLVGEAIESVLNQTFGDFEFIIIDDGSTDNTADVISSYKDERIQYHYQQNQDAYNAINNGMAKVRGEFIAILNSDDVYLPNRFERMLAFQEKREAQCLFTDVIPVSDESEEFTDPDFGWNLWHQKNRDKYFELNDIYAAFLHGNFMVTTSNLLLTAKAAKKVGGFTSLRYLHDYDFIFRVMLEFPKHTFYMHDERLLKYRIHSGNTLGEAAITGREQDRQVIRKYLLAKCPETNKLQIETGINRLIALEHELLEVTDHLAANELATQQMSQQSSPIRGKMRSFLRSLVRR
jgi:glycosyltransferase involved in cell wall biosynthesis